MIGAVLRGEEEARKWFNGTMKMREAADFLGLSQYMLRKLVKEDKIPYCRIRDQVIFHRDVLNAWMRGDFIGGRIALILDEITIDFDHEDALREHFQRYPHLMEIEKENEKQLAITDSGYRCEVSHDGVTLNIGDEKIGITSQVFLTHAAVDEIFRALQKFKTGLK